MKRWHAVVGGCLSVAIVAACYWPVLNYEFVSWDDNRYVTDNASIQQLDFTHAKQWFTRSYVQLYVPLTIASYAIDYARAGLNAHSYHATNLALHLLNVGLVYVLLCLLFRNAISACLGALLFGLHPAQVPVVAWISERKSLLSATFAFSALLALGTYAHSPKKRWAAVVWLGFAGSLLSRPTAILAPLLGLHAFVGKHGRRLLVGGALVISGTLALVTIRFYPYLKLPSTPAAMGELLVHQLAVAGRYIQIIFWPVDLHFFMEPLHTPSWTIFATALALSGVLITGWLYRKENIGLFVTWCVLFILPVVSLFEVPVRSHHLYISMFGVVGLILSFSKARVLPWILGAGVVACLFLTGPQLERWQTSRHFWEDALRHGPDDYLAHVHLANVYAEEGNSDDAQELYKRAITLRGTAIEPFTNWANLSLAQGKLGLAVYLVQKMQKRWPDAPDTALLRAMIFKEIPAPGHTLYEFKRARKLDPQNAYVHYNFALYRLTQGQIDSAIRGFKQALRLKPNLSAAYYYLGLAYMRQAQWQLAVNVFAKMQDRQLDYSGMYFQMGYAWLKLGDREKARMAYQTSVRVHPEVEIAKEHLWKLTQAR